MKQLLIVFAIIQLVTITAGYSQNIPLNWRSVAAGVWKVKIGQPQKFDLLRTANIHPRIETLRNLGERNFPLLKEECHAELQNGKIYLRFPLEKEEQLFGLGLNFKTINQRGRIMTLHVDHYNGIDNGRTHAPVPFYVSTKGYGVLVNSAEYITVYAGTGIRVNSKHPPKVYNRNTDKNWEAQPYSDAVEILVPANGTEVYVFAGNNTMEVVQRYNLYNGGGVLPPKWGLGFTQRVPTLSTEDDIRKEVADFKEHHFPLDFIGLEPGWQTKSYPCTFEWDTTRFSNPADFVREMKDSGLRLNLWLNPYLSPSSSLYQELKPVSGSHTVWNGLVPDFNVEKARKIYKSLFSKEHIDIGISGYKIDEVDGYDNWLWPDVATFPSGITAMQMRQTFGLQMQKMTSEWFKEKNTRTYGLVRASNAGASSFPYVIYNDYYNHRDFITALCNSGFIGVLWTPEVRSSATAEEWLRRMQSVCFSPMAMLNAWSDGTKPWSYPEVSKQVMEVATLRMQLLPYIYNCFAQYYFEGKPPVRAMNLEEGFSFSPKQFTAEINSVTNPYALATREDVKDQFMLGDYLLVAPMFAGDKKRKVVLPQGKWYNFYTGEYAGKGEIIEIEPGLDNIPLYVKDGGIVPMIPPVLHAPTPGETLPLELRHYGESKGSISLYDDDGETFNYKKGNYMRYSFSATKDSDGKWIGKEEIFNKNKMTQQYKNFSWKFMAGDKK
ncbi:TIM-barrel domain-containing protein [Segetibacter koreensis]|uniref:TIM-barrel domain-containing protein n=1 Tax=Segetibacter koreensis TaxID=398037 RepID=UPI00047647B6|nr:TIM-barrel domain-containing protein [Segetibacter koreensis]